MAKANTKYTGALPKNPAPTTVIKGNNTKGQGTNQSQQHGKMMGTKQLGSMLTRGSARGGK